ncbi:hypothetical protein [Evansella tamaricis]|uniref:Uncharacterized protein n=1 Tax=Evansella tamaricis TaxID=2069301 RepID=A0ABS6J9W9_9BACI|nr:hypothetical protein [Evansella tamaricis]MBU9710395.1 hypothetical protein [Evansella tamaricis]
MKINLNKKQYKQLLDLAFIAEWKANSSKRFEERNKEVYEIFQYLCSLAKDFGYGDIITYNSDFDEYFPTVDYEESLLSVIEGSDFHELDTHFIREMDSSDLDFISKVDGKINDTFDQGIEKISIKKPSSMSLLT